MLLILAIGIMLFCENDKTTSVVFKALYHAELEKNKSNLTVALPNEYFFLGKWKRGLFTLVVTMETNMYHVSKLFWVSIVSFVLSHCS